MLMVHYRETVCCHSVHVLQEGSCDGSARHCRGAESARLRQIAGHKRHRHLAAIDVQEQGCRRRQPAGRSTRRVMWFVGHRSDGSSQAYSCICTCSFHPSSLHVNVLMSTVTTRRWRTYLIYISVCDSRAVAARPSLTYLRTPTYVCTQRRYLVQLYYGAPYQVVLRVVILV